MATMGKTAAWTVASGTLQIMGTALEAGGLDVPMHVGEVFLAAALLGGEATQEAIRERLGRTESSISRSLAALGRGRPDRPGRGLLETIEDPYNRRRRLVRLTPQGARMAAAVADEIARLVQRNVRGN